MSKPPDRVSAAERSKNREAYLAGYLQAAMDAKYLVLALTRKSSIQQGILRMVGFANAKLKYWTKAKPLGKAERAKPPMFEATKFVESRLARELRSRARTEVGRDGLAKTTAEGRSVIGALIGQAAEEGEDE